ncbi:response regulator [Massilia sp. CCM 8693]|uniref:Response regulator n=1 Tax=Massilia aquatica TaxID=2609000 RepID=A0ABX0M4F2_9BURK|nr:response regulator [Massilia aquatica]
MPGPSRRCGVRLWLAVLIGAQGYQVRVVGDGDAGLRLAVQEPVDAFILDIGLPGMDGYEPARRLRATPGGHAAKLMLRHSCHRQK